MCNRFRASSQLPHSRSQPHTSSITRICGCSKIFQKLSGDPVARRAAACAVATCDPPGRLAGSSVWPTRTLIVSWIHMTPMRGLPAATALRVAWRQQRPQRRCLRRTGVRHLCRSRSAPHCGRSSLATFRRWPFTGRCVDCPRGSCAAAVGAMRPRLPRGQRRQHRVVCQPVPSMLHAHCTHGGSMPALRKPRTRHPHATCRATYRWTCPWKP